ncbi:sulfotransferase family protein [Rhizobium tropici]|uniref:Sulfotransferase family protein n=1 Tax=Rhizobium tropici TaxID=398 RepID=A0A5B0WE15_RHITR|nr:sulfotransferase family 2 domain-containing protein [Rhizobium tropici]KAA1184421.1 sulfotransferase family protein [Rhizobium tropici]
MVAGGLRDFAHKMRFSRTKCENRYAEALPSEMLALATAVYFLHIPKTAGTTIQHLLAEKFGERIYPEGLWDNLWNENFSPLDNWDVFWGHFGFAFARMLGRPSWIFTFLRDPFERTISHFLHVKRDQGHPYHKYLLNKTFEEFVFDPVAVPLVYNVQSRYLAYPFSADACGARIPPGQTTNAVSVTWELMSYGMKDDEIHSCAFTALDKINFVGFVEHMDESVNQLARHLDLNVGEIPKLNVSAIGNQIEDISDRARERVAKLTLIDKELYDAARAKFTGMGALRP